jgi:hypothetical protein
MRIRKRQCLDAHMGRDDGIKTYQEVYECLWFNPPMSACCGRLAGMVIYVIRNAEIQIIAYSSLEDRVS